MLQAYAMPIYAGYAFQASSLYLTPAILLLMALAIPLASLLSHPLPASKSLLNKHGSGLFSDNSPRVMSAFRIIRVVRGWDPMPVGRPGITQMITMITTFLRFKNMSVHGQAATTRTGLSHRSHRYMHGGWGQCDFQTQVKSHKIDHISSSYLANKNRRKCGSCLWDCCKISLQGHQVFHGISVARLTPPTPRLPIWDQVVVKIRQNHSSIRQQMSGDYCFPSHWSCRGSDCRPPVPALWLSSCSLLPFPWAHLKSQCGTAGFDFVWLWYPESS